MRSLLLAMFLSLVACGAGCREKPKAALRILLGSSMATPGQQIAREFGQAKGMEVLCDLGGCESLFPKIKLGAGGDIFVCHDPFENQVKEIGQYSGSAAVGYLRPELVVRPGNPREIKSIEDLARPGMKVGIGDPRYSTCGEMFVGLLKKRGLEEKVMQRVELQARTHAELANGVTVGPLDAAVIWNFAAAMYGDKLQVVPTDAKYEPVRVTVVGLKQSKNPAMRDQFIEYCRAQSVREVFKKAGYTE